MLVVFHGAPGAAPDEAVFDEQAVAEVAFIDLVAELLATDGQGHHRHDAPCCFIQDSPTLRDLDGLGDLLLRLGLWHGFGQDGTDFKLD